MKMLTFPDGKARPRRSSSQTIPDELVDEGRHCGASSCSKQLSTFSDELMELALAEEPIPEELIRKVLREATLHRQIQPVLCGSALHGIGVQPLLDAVADYLPSPARHAAGRRVDPIQQGEHTEVRRQERRTVQGHAQARSRRAVLRPGVQDPAVQDGDLY